MGLRPICQLAFYRFCPIRQLVLRWSDILKRLLSLMTIFTFQSPSRTTVIFCCKYLYCRYVELCYRRSNIYTSILYKLQYSYLDASVLNVEVHWWILTKQFTLSSLSQNIYMVFFGNSKILRHFLNNLPPEHCVSKKVNNIDHYNLSLFSRYHNYS